MGYARISIAVEYLLDRLALPAETRILNAEVSGDGRDVILSVQHQDIKDTPILFGERPPIIYPKMRRQSDIVMVDWGQEKTK